MTLRDCDAAKPVQVTMPYELAVELEKLISRRGQTLVYQRNTYGMPIYAVMQTARVGDLQKRTVYPEALRNVAAGKIGTQISREMQEWLDMPDDPAVPVGYHVWRRGSFITQMRCVRCWVWLTQDSESTGCKPKGLYSPTAGN